MCDRTYFRYSQYSSLILTLLMWSFFLLAHWLACVWYVIAEKELESSAFSIYSRDWMSMLAVQNRYNDTRCIPDSEAYITALYFTCTSLTTVGFGNVSANTKEMIVDPQFIVAINPIHVYRILILLRLLHAQ